MTLDDGNLQTSKIIQIWVTDTAPSFTSLIIDPQSVYINDDIVYVLPSTIDSEGNPITVSLGANTPLFVTLES